MTAKTIVNFTCAVRKASTKPTTNNLISPFVFNRNPRNLELLRLEKKPCGYGVDNKELEYWHKYEKKNVLYKCK